MLIAILSVVAVLVLALPLCLVALDRAGADRAERAAARHLAPHLDAPPGTGGGQVLVRVRGRPFLTQALRGRYRDVEVVGAVRVGEVGTAPLVAHLVNARLPARVLLGRGLPELACDHVSGRLVLSYDGLARAARMPGLALAFDGQRLLASAALPVSLPGFEQFTRVSGEARLLLRDGSALLQIKNVAVAGVAVPSFALRQLLPALTVPIDLPALPYGLRLDDLTPTASGLVVKCSASAAVFRAAVPAHEPLLTSRDARPSE